MAAAASSSTLSSASNNSKPALLYKFKITLNDRDDPQGSRWRRVIAPANFSLLELHVVIQVVFGWANYHLHHFIRHRGPRGFWYNPESTEYSIIDEEFEPCFAESKEERICKLYDVFSELDPVLDYEYDFGASWELEVKFEGTAEEDPNLNYPACIDGSGGNRKEDRNDEDSYGNLLPRYKGKQFNLQQNQYKLRKLFTGKWPLKFDNATLPQCYLCMFHLCSRCNGRCCNCCLKADFLR